MFGSDNNLSLAASAVSRIREHAWMDYALDGSGELGDRIARAHTRAVVEAVGRYGFTPGEYNEALRERLAPDYPTMSYRIHNLLTELEAETLDDFDLDNTFVDTGAGEQSSLRYLAAA